MPERGRIQELLLAYRSNITLLKKWEKDKTLRECRTDYDARRRTGGLLGQNPADHTRSKKDGLSIQEKLLLEQQNVLEKVERIRTDVELTRLLLFQLNDFDHRLMNLRYEEGKDVRDICAILFISKSSFYRRLNAIVQEMSKAYDRFYQDVNA